MTLLSEMNNNAPSDNVVLRHAVEQIQRVLPSHWSTNVALKTNDVADARLTIKTPAGASAALAPAGVLMVSRASATSFVFRATFVDQWEGRTR